MSQLEAMRCTYCKAPLPRTTLKCKYCDTEHESSYYMSQGFSDIDLSSGTYVMPFAYHMGSIANHYRRPKQPDKSTIRSVYQ